MNNWKFPRQKKLLKTGISFLAALAVLLGALLLVLSTPSTNESISAELVEEADKPQTTIAKPLPVVTRAITGSQDGNWLAFVLDRWTNGQAQGAAYVFGDANGGQNRYKFPLTPEYTEVVEGPDPSVIAYLTKEMRGASDQYNVYILGVVQEDYRKFQNRTPDVPFSVLPWRQHETIKTVKRNLQFSQDGGYLRYLEKESVHSENEAYRYVSVQGETPKMDVVHRLKWLPAKEPAAPPSYITARQPKIHEETQPVWSADSSALYVHDKEGVWRRPFSPTPRNTEWSLFYPTKNVRAFQLSSDGKRMLLEIGSKQRRVAVVDLESEGARPHDLGEGWSARFSPDGTQYAFLSRRGAFIGDADSAPRRLKGKTQPEFHSSSRLEWPRNSTLLYAHDAKGIWSAEPDINGSGWKLEVKVEGVHTFHITSWVRPRFYISEESPRPEPEITTSLMVETDGNPVFSRARESGFVPMAADENSGNYYKEQVGGRFGDGATLGTNMKERRITQINLSDEKNKTYHKNNGWGAGKDGRPLNCWIYHANFNGLHVMKGEGFCGLGFSFSYIE